MSKRRFWLLPIYRTVPWFLYRNRSPRTRVVTLVFENRRSTAPGNVRQCHRPSYRAKTIQQVWLCIFSHLACAGGNPVWKPIPIIGTKVNSYPQSNKTMKDRRADCLSLLPRAKARGLKTDNQHLFTVIRALFHGNVFDAFPVFVFCLWLFSGLFPPVLRQHPRLLR